MSRPSNLSLDNILRFLQVRNAPLSADEIISGLHLKKSDRRPLYKMLSKLKKRAAISELPGGRYRLGGRKPGADQRPPKDDGRRVTKDSGPAQKQQATTKAGSSVSQPALP